MMIPGKQLSYIKPFNEVLLITEFFVRKNVTALLAAAEIIVYYHILVKKNKDCLYFSSLIC